MKRSRCRGSNEEPPLDMGTPGQMEAARGDVSLREQKGQLAYLIQRTKGV
jgi:hypothetical protein